MTPILTNGRLSLLWRTLLLLTLCVLIIQVCLYLWIQRSVNSHFEQMDAEILTHAAFNLRQQLSDSVLDVDEQGIAPPIGQSMAVQSQPSLEFDYGVKTLITDNEGQIIASTPQHFSSELGEKFSVKALRQQYREQPFDIKINQRHYRAIVIAHSERLALIALPIDVHHQYLVQFNRQLIFILIAITIILVSVAALSVHLGFAPLSTIRQKMTRINAEQLDDRINISEMPSELRALAEAYNAMMKKLEHNFDSLGRFSDDIAHELRTPLATLSTQTQVMLSKPRERCEYIEQLHHQHETLAQLSVMINNMLLLAKTQTGLHSAQLSDVDIDSVVTKVMTYFEFMAEDRGITFEKVGAFSQVWGDDSLLQRLFTNLISNTVYYAASDSVILIEALPTEVDTCTDSAIDNTQNTLLQSPANSTTYLNKYSLNKPTLKQTSLKNRTLKEPSLKTPSLKTSSLKTSSLKINITNQLDTPLTQAEADKLFERFYRHDKTNTRHAGTGLGLSIVKAITDAHNGKMGIVIKDKYRFQVSVEL